jgi:hypothetical protein
MSIIIKSLENHYASATPESIVRFEVVEQVGAFSRIVDTLTLTMQGSYTLSDPALMVAIRATLVGTAWEMYLT